MEVFNMDKSGSMFVEKKKIKAEKPAQPKKAEKKVELKRVIIDIPYDLYSEVKIKAIQEKKTMKQMVVELFQECIK